ncbi:DUF5677 domain-containing protein [Peribacillus butanolivorans]|uniref:DUF5677 domain-containing protein n=1 Tax=Peribacillus butanolivorans TaxID=421767 RepID=UPI0036730D1C
MTFYVDNIEDFENKTNLNVLSKVIRFAEYLLEEIIKDRTFIQQDKAILVFFRQLVEQADGVYLAMDQDSISLARTSIRNAFESSLALMYILEEAQSIGRRALSYIVHDIHEEIQWIEHAIETNVLAEHISTEELETAKQAKLNKLSTRQLQPIEDEWIRTDAALPQSYSPKWYSLFNGPRSIKQLARHLNPTSAKVKVIKDLQFSIINTK